MGDIDKTKRIVEALLIAAGDGVRREDLREVIGNIEPRELEDCINSLREEYGREERAFSIMEIAGRYRIVTKSEYAVWVNKLYQTEPTKLSGPSLETLAIIAYKQPVTRAEIEFVRGVNAGGVLKTLLDRGLILVKGRKDVIGKPLLYGTTKKFMEYFGLSNVDDLPALRDFREEDLDYESPREGQFVENVSGEGENEEGADNEE